MDDPTTREQPPAETTAEPHKVATAPFTGAGTKSFMSSQLPQAVPGPFAETAGIITGDDVIKAEKQEPLPISEGNRHLLNNQGSKGAPDPEGRVDEEIPVTNGNRHLVLR